MMQTKINIILNNILSDPAFSEGPDWHRQCFEVDEVIINEGDEGGSLFLIEQGKLRVSGNVNLEKHKQIQMGIWELVAGDIFGELALHQRQLRTSSVRAISGGCLIEINGEKLLAYLEAHPQQGYLFYKEIFELLVTKLNRANHRVNDLFAWGLKVHEIEPHL